MAQEVGIQGASSVFYNVYVREQASYTRPVDLTEIATLQGTGSQTGVIEKDSIIPLIEPGETVMVQNGGKNSEFVKDFNCSIELKNINGSEANIDDFITSYEGKRIDVILDDPVAKRMYVITNILPKVTEEVTILTLAAAEVVQNKSQFRDRFSYADFV